MEHTWQQKKRDHYRKKLGQKSNFGAGPRSKRNWGISARVGASLLSLMLAVGPAFSQSGSVDSQADHQKTETPIKHVIVIIGENRTFDHVFATYVPQNGQTVWNLLSEGIVKADGTPGPNFPLAEQKAATNKPPDDFLLSPTTSSYSVLPTP